MGQPFFTIGHSNRTFDDFVDLLRATGIEMVVDVRRLPGSRRNPHFNEDVLWETLPAAGIRYRREAGLGGRRSASKDVPADANGYWDNRSFHNYADYALSDEFREALIRLREWGADQRVAVMCSEAVWWRCHRRIIADHLLANGEEVFHIIGGRPAEPAQLTPGAVIDANGTVIYPGPSTTE